MDRLAALFNNITLSAREFYSGTVCGDAVFDDSSGLGCLHVIRSGYLTVKLQHHENIQIDQPSLLFFPRSYKHGFHSGVEPVAEITCALVEFADGLSSPFISALPDFLLIPLSSSVEIERAVTILFEEAFSKRAGRQVTINRLFEYVVILLLRHLIEMKSLDCGILAGLADEKLARAITMMHEHPDQTFSLNNLARIAGMSRARFASHFRNIVGATPFDYLSDWRISIALPMIKKGIPINMVAPTVGYTSCAAFTRAFTKKTGYSPRAWMRRGETTCSANAHA
jgi:AraC-like DNA-binding protein